MAAMVRMPGVPDSEDAYTMNAIAVDVPMATLAVTAGGVEISTSSVDGKDTLRRLIAFNVEKALL